MSAQIYIDFKQSIISNHNKILDNLELKYSQRISELLMQKRLITSQIQQSFMNQLDNINQLITNSQQRKETEIINKNKSSTPEPNKSSTKESTPQLVNSNDKLTLKYIEQNTDLLQTPINIEHTHNTLVNLLITKQPSIEKIIPSNGNSTSNSANDVISDNNFKSKIIKHEPDRKYNTGTYILNLNDAEQSGLIKCEYCDYKTDSKPRMIIHVRIHFKDKPFKCDICLKTYTTNSALIVHKRTHSNTLPFKCKICHKLFNQIPHLRYHLLSHTNEKPWVCKNCKQSFKTKKYLQNHVKKMCINVDKIIKNEPLLANQLLDESLILSRGHGLCRVQNMSDLLQIKKEENISIFNGKQYSKAGQCFDEPDKYVSSRIFYESLYMEDNQNIMAISYCVFYGCFEEEQAQQLYHQYKDALLPRDTFEICI